ncbi:MAG TPA: type II secretion system F family protein [Acidimicrobiia bacterium]
MTFTPLTLAAAILSATFAMALARVVFPAPARLSTRVRPYLTGSEPEGVPIDGSAASRRMGPVRRVLLPPMVALVSLMARWRNAERDTALRLRLEQAGFTTEGDAVADFRLRQMGSALAGLFLGYLLAVALHLTGPQSLGLAAVGAVVGATRLRSRLDRQLEDRVARMRIEIYTIDQLLALRVRTGGGVVSAVQDLCRRASGDVVSELSEALRLHRAGMPAAAAFQHIGATTPQPACARTYLLLAAAEERGADLAPALLALADDVREERRDDFKRASTKRRAALLVPIIAVLAPVMLLFVGAPLPSLVLGWN